jgi:predicted nucleotidyltransferase
MKRVRRKQEQIQQTLAENSNKIKSFGVKRIGLFGSYARGEATDSSDLDFIVEFRNKSFDSYMNLKFYLEDLFGCNVDLVIPETIKPRLRPGILKETVYAPGFHTCANTRHHTRMNP